MEEFTSIAIWIFMAFLITNTMVVWFSESSFFSETNFAIQEIQEDTSFGLTAQEELRQAYYNQVCAEALPQDPAYAGCLISTISNAFGTAISIPGRLLGGLWNFAFAWHNLLTSIFTGVPGANLFTGILIPFLTLVQITSILVIIMKLASIIRGAA